MIMNLCRRRGHKNCLDPEHQIAVADARALALELVRGLPMHPIDTMSAGIVLGGGETAFRQVSTWIYTFESPCWATPAPVDVLITDQRLVCRLPAGQLASLPWSGMMGLSIDLADEHVLVDYGDGQPHCFAGSATAVLAVAAVACVCGLPALITHPALGPLRR